MKHRCSAEGCDVLVPLKMLMCGYHWYQVPKPLRNAVWDTFRPGQEIDKRPSDAYRDAAYQAVEALARQEGRR